MLTRLTLQTPSVGRNQGRRAGYSLLLRTRDPLMNALLHRVKASGVIAVCHALSADLERRVEEARC